MRLVCSVDRRTIARMHGLGRIQNRCAPRGQCDGRISRYVPHLYVAGLHLAPPLPRGMAFKQSNRRSVSYLISCDSRPGSGASLSAMQGNVRYLLRSGHAIVRRVANVNAPENTVRRTTLPSRKSACCGPQTRLRMPSKTCPRQL